MLNLFSKSINVQVILLTFFTRFIIARETTLYSYLTDTYTDGGEQVTIRTATTQSLMLGYIPIGPISTIYWIVTPKMEHSDYSTTGISGDALTSYSLSTTTSGNWATTITYYVVYTPFLSMTTTNTITSNLQGAETLTYATIVNTVTGRNGWATTETTYFIAIPKTTSHTNSDTTSKTNSHTDSHTTSKTNSDTNSDMNSYIDSTLSSSSFTDSIATAPTCEPETSTITVTNSSGNVVTQTIVVTEPCESNIPSTSNEADLTSTITLTDSDGKVTQTTTIPFVTGSVPPLYTITEVSSGSTTSNLV